MTWFSQIAQSQVAASHIIMRSNEIGWWLRVGLVYVSIIIQKNCIYV